MRRALRTAVAALLFLAAFAGAAVLFAAYAALAGIPAFLRSEARKFAIFGPR